MVTLCAYLYPDGRTCRRIPRRGDDFCRDHLRLASVRTPGEEEAFIQQMLLATDEIAAMPLDQRLNHLGDCLGALDPLIESRASSAERAFYTRATIAATSAFDCVLALPGVLAQVFPGMDPDVLAVLVHIVRNALPPPCRTIDDPPQPASETRAGEDRAQSPGCGQDSLLAGCTGQPAPSGTQRIDAKTAGPQGE